MKTRMYFAPGRVNLIGEHTDYNGGYVLPCAVDVGTYAYVRTRTDKSVNMYSVNKPGRGVITFDLDNIQNGNDDGWGEYPKGVFQTIKDMGYKLEKGMDITYFGDLPAGSGLASSASIEIVTATLINDIYELELDNLVISKMCQESENKYNSTRCGIMDQMTVAMGKADNAMYLKSKTLEYKYVPMDMEDYQIVIANSGKKHFLANSEYNKRREECEQALKYIKTVRKDIKYLCDLTPEEFEEIKYCLDGKDTLIKRARHVIYENQRTIEALEYLEDEDIEGLGELMNKSHISMRNDYEASSEEVDILAEAAWMQDGCVGSRITGGGFGGCTVSIVDKDEVDNFVAGLKKEYKEKTGNNAQCFIMNIGDGARCIEKGELCKGTGANALIQWAITCLVGYGIAKKLIWKEDINYVVNQLLGELHVDEYTGSRRDIINASDDVRNIEKKKLNTGLLELLLNIIDDYAAYHGLIERDTVVCRDMFDTRIMGTMAARPSEAIRRFEFLKRYNSKEATDWFYSFSKDINYIRRDRIKKNVKWKVHTEYGDLDITINLSKPEKDPRDIAAAKNVEAGYPKCLLCIENEGYTGRDDYPARENLRIMPVKLDGENWGFQYSPYVYYNEHCIVMDSKHTPMRIDHSTFEKLFDFVKMFPHYFIGSNADLPIVGGSILGHNHFQGGNYTFPMAMAPIEEEISIYDYKGVHAGIVKWPMSVIRLSSNHLSKLLEMADKILDKWKNYSDELVGLYARTKDENGDYVYHNTITPIARKVGDMYQLDMVLRNNLTSKEHPLGVFHPHEELHHIKKENIGLIEVMGLAVLPARLKGEINKIRKIMINNKKEDIYELVKADEEISKHAEWVKTIVDKHRIFDAKSASVILKDEIGYAFAKVLEDAGVFKRDQEGRMAFERFIRIL